MSSCQYHLAPLLSTLLLAVVLAPVVVLGIPSRSRDRSNNQRRNHEAYPPPLPATCGSLERYHSETSKCHPVDSQGPCGENMVFVEDPHNQLHGKCRCVDHIGCEYWPFTYWAPENTCYPLFDQGPCRDGEWLVPSPDRLHQLALAVWHSHSRDQQSAYHGVCVPRTCPPAVNEGPNKMFTHRGTCYMTNTQGFCSTPQERLFFPRGSPEPKCFVKPPAGTKVCPAAPYGGGSFQEIVVITPKPPVTPVLSVPADVPPLVTPVLEGAPPLSTTSPTVTHNMTKTLSKAGVLDCPSGQVRTDDGCAALALFSK